MEGVEIDTLALLQAVQQAFTEAESTNNQELKNAAESVLSAIVVVLRWKKAFVPPALAPHIALVVRRRG